jgi:hypothetical protein
VFVPGYAISWLLNLYDFRRRVTAFRLAFSVPLSIAICPVVSYLLGRFGGMTAVWLFYALSLCAFVAVLVRSAPPLPTGKELRIILCATAVWLLIALGSLIDIQIGARLYYPTSALDNSIRAAFIHSLSVTGIPPQTPLFLTGQPAPLRYHYFWLLMCSLVERAGGSAITARQALIAGTFWCGVGLLSIVALFLRLFAPGDPARLHRRIKIAFLLLGVTGLDILPTAFLLILHARGLLPIVLPSVEWWNEHVDWFVYTTLWAPHALSSLLACLTGFLLLWNAPQTPGRRGFLRYCVPAGIALASAIGASIYVSLVFAIFLTVWTAITVLRKWWPETKTLLIAGSVCILLALPYLLSLLGPSGGAGGAAGGAPLQFTVRTFSMAALIPAWRGMTSTSRLLLVNFPLIPINYLLEFGFFFGVGVIQWRRFRRRGLPMTRQQLACVAIAASGFLICTFVRSSVIGCNDLGWRGFLPAEFVLLLWGADLLADRSAAALAPSEWRLLIGFMVLGAAGSVYDLALTRTYPILADRGLVPPLDWMAPDRQFGPRTYAARTAYEWARISSAETAAIQFNPKVTFEETTAMLYADRRTVAADTNCNVTFGGDARLCAPIVSRLNQLYTGQDSGTANACREFPIDLIVAKDTDPVWQDRNSWVWRETAAFQSPYVRIFRCRNPHLGKALAGD